METKKMGLANFQGKLSRAEMKKIMAGNVPGNSCAVYLPPGTGNSGTTWCQWGTSACSGVGFSSGTYSNGTFTAYGMTAADAQAQAVGAGAHWCCSSCSSASWYNPPSPA